MYFPIISQQASNQRIISLFIHHVVHYCAGNVGESLYLYVIHHLPDSEIDIIESNYPNRIPRMIVSHWLQQE